MFIFSYLYNSFRLQVLKKYLLIILFFSTNAIGIQSQKHTLEELKVALSFKICEYVGWNEVPHDTFHITVITVNPVLYDMFQSLSKGYSIKGHPVSVRRITVRDSLPHGEMLYIDEANLKYASTFWNSQVHKQLLLTENHKVPKEIMFNLLPNKNKGSVTFEFNRTNLIFEGFDIADKIIELRGSEIDVRELYRQTKTRLEKEETRVLILQTRLDSQWMNINNLNQIIFGLNASIQNLNTTVDSQKTSIRQQETSLLMLSKTAIEKENEIHKNLKTIKQQNENINGINKAIDLQQKSVDSLNLVIGQKQKNIQAKDDVLAQKDLLINFKNNLIYLLWVFIVLVVAFVFFIFRAYRINKAAKLILAEQKEELEVTLEKLTQAQNKLIQSEKMASLGVLTAGIAHEINNPINFISSGIQGLKKINKGILSLLNAYREHYKTVETNEAIQKFEKQYDYLFLQESANTLMGNIQTGVDRTVHIVKSLRTLTHSDNEQKSDVNINESIELALTILFNQYKYNIEIIKNFGNLPLFKGYAGKLNQVFMNLITNAIQAIPDKGNIWITTGYENQWIKVSIRDSGIGISNDIKGKIFDPFFTTKEVGKGTGLGLSIVLSIIEEHLGKIEVKSIEHGSEFIISLPVKNE